VNIIQLDDSKEHLRDSVFFSIFRKSLIFDDFELAAQYRKQLRAEGSSPPTLYTRRGDRITSDGLFNPSIYTFY